MRPLIACGTWIRDNDRAIIDYISKCDVFPEIPMIAEATGLPEKRIARTLKSLNAQERMYKGRRALIEE